MIKYSLSNEISNNFDTVEISARIAKYDQLETAKFSMKLVF